MSSVCKHMLPQQVLQSACAHMCLGVCPRTRPVAECVRRGPEQNNTQRWGIPSCGSVRPSLCSSFKNHSCLIFSLAPSPHPPPPSPVGLWKCRTQPVLITAWEVEIRQAPSWTRATLAALPSPPMEQEVRRQNKFYCCSHEQSIVFAVCVCTLLSFFFHIHLVFMCLGFNHQHQTDKRFYYSVQL